MPTPLKELQAQVDALRADVEFVRLASQLRLRVGKVLQWQAQGEETDLAKRFINSQPSSPEAVYGPLLVRLLASLERYMRNTITDIVDHKAANASSYDSVAGTLGNRNLVLTGRLLSTLDAPRDYLTLNVEELIENLASCRRGSGKFRLNSIAFSSALGGVSPSVLEKAFDNLEISGWWDRIGADAKITALLGTKGARATGDRAKERLKELARWRNHLAHGGDGEILISESQIDDAIEFVRVFGVAFEAVVR
jgi:hypothetical protein